MTPSVHTYILWGVFKIKPLYVAFFVCISYNPKHIELGDTDMLQQLVEELEAINKFRFELKVYPVGREVRVKLSTFKTVFANENDAVDFSNRINKEVIKAIEDVKAKNELRKAEIQALLEAKSVDTDKLIGILHKAIDVLKEGK